MLVQSETPMSLLARLWWLKDSLKRLIFLPNFAIKISISLKIKKNIKKELKWPTQTQQN